MGKNSKKLTPRKKKAHGGDPKENDPTSLPKENAIPERNSGVFNFMWGELPPNHVARYFFGLSLSFFVCLSFSVFMSLNIL